MCVCLDDVVGAGEKRISNTKKKMLLGYYTPPETRTPKLIKYKFHYSDTYYSDTYIRKLMKCTQMFIEFCNLL